MVSELTWEEDTLQLQKVGVFTFWVSLHNSLGQIRMRLIDEFKKPKSGLQFIIELKEIKYFLTESMLDFYHLSNMILGSYLRE